MTTITCYGGVQEVGGNKILVESDRARVWLDFGMSFTQANRYLSEFLQPRKCNGVLDFLTLGLLPNLPDKEGLYRHDYLRHSGFSPRQDPAYSAAFFTHAHMDHVAYIHFLREDIPLYMSQVTKTMLSTIETTSRARFKDLVSFTQTFKIRPKKKGEGYTKVEGEEAKVARKILSFEDRGSFDVEDLRIQAFSVNHSLPGALGYVIRAPEGSIGYTGDLRFHGYHGDDSKRFVRELRASPVDVLICEGTRAGENTSIGESDVRDRVLDVVRGCPALVIIDYPERDTERLKSFLEVAKASGRQLAINLQQAYLLEALAQVGADVPPINDPSLVIYVPRKEWGLITKAGFPDEIVKQEYNLWEREYLTRPNHVTADDIRKNQDKFIVRIDFFELPQLVDLQPTTGSCYVRSTTEPIDEEDEIDLKRAEEWLKLFNLYPHHQIHCSGHMGGHDLREMVETVNPKVLIPVHTEHPELFAEALKGTSVEVVLPQYGHPIVLS